MKKPSKPKFFRHLEGLNISAVFSDCGNYRYLLEIEKNAIKRGKKVCAIMLNPSIADENQADKSVQFLEKLIFEKSTSYFKNVTTLSIVNLFAFIQTRDFEGKPDQVGPRNDKHLEAGIAAADIVLIAWGKTSAHQQRKARVLEVLERYPGKKILVTKIHPSRGHYANFITEFQS
ncbi:DUF1643 domain-containing protein [Flavobacteriaceae bacterium D16]|nr:DUF1643 domain-containing protein [Flavobacteriaceae bacterium D16]